MFRHTEIRHVKVLAEQPRARRKLLHSSAGLRAYSRTEIRHVKVLAEQRALAANSCTAALAFVPPAAQDYAMIILGCWFLAAQPSTCQSTFGFAQD